MKRNRKTIATIFVVICILILCGLPISAYNANDDYNLLLNYGFESEYLESLTDTKIEKIAASVRDSADIEKEDARKILLSCGYPEEFIAPLPETVVKKMAYVVKGNEIVDVIYEDELDIPDTKNITIKSVTVKIKNENSDNVEKELICLYWEWDIRKPFIREEDYIGARWNKELLICDDDTFYSESYWRDKESDSWITSDVYTALAASGQNYLGVWTELKKFKNQVGGVMIFELHPKSSGDIGMEYENELTFIYLHKYEKTKIVILFVLLIMSVCVLILLIIKLKKLRKIKNLIYFLN